MVRVPVPRTVRPRRRDRESIRGFSCPWTSVWFAFVWSVFLPFLFFNFLAAERRKSLATAEGRGCQLLVSLAQLRFRNKANSPPKLGGEAAPKAQTGAVCSKFARSALLSDIREAH